MAFDFKKEYKEFYLPATKPAIVKMPAMNYLAVRGKGNPNEEGGAYKQALEQLYGIAYTLKMSYKSDYRIEGFFEYVVPPLEGLWWAEDGEIDYANKDKIVGCLWGILGVSLAELGVCIWSSIDATRIAKVKNQYYQGGKYAKSAKLYPSVNYIQGEKGCIPVSGMTFALAF